MPKFEEVKPFQRSMTYQWYRKAERWDVDGIDRDGEWTELDQLLRDVQLDLEDIGAAKAFDITYSIELDTSNPDVMSNTYLTTKSPPPPRKVEFLRSDSFEKAVMGVLKDITKLYREIHKSPVSSLTTLRPPEPDDDEPVGTGLFLTKRLAEVNRDWIPIDSSFISKIRYSELAGKLDIRFKNGSVYTFDVPKEVFDAFLVAPSKGRFCNEVILKQYARSFKVFNRESEGFNWYRQSQSQTVMDTSLESVTESQWQEINDRMVAIGYDFKGVADVKRIFKKYNDLNGLSGLPDHKKVYDAVVSGKEYISKPDPKKSRNAFNRAIRYFGTTNALYECGYILPNGVMLDLSGKNMGNALRYVGLSRGLDHGEINQIMAMPEFIATGGIRHFPEQPGVEIGKEPSNAQLDIIYRDVEGSGRGYVVEIKDPRKPRFYQEYDAGVRGTKVISDIKRYYGRQAGTSNWYKQAEDIGDISQYMSKSVFEDMMERGYNTVKEFLLEEEPPVTTWREWIDSTSSDNVSATITSYSHLYDRFLSDLPGEIRVDDLIDAYKQKRLVDKPKERYLYPRFNLKDVKEEASVKLPWEKNKPKDLSNEQLIQLYNTAITRTTKANSKTLLEARRNLFFAYNTDRELYKKLNISSSELNKKIKMLAGFNVGSRDIEEQLNRDVPEDHQWSGITNASYMGKSKLAIQDVDKFVKGIKINEEGARYYYGEPGEQLRKHIATAFLAIDSKIDYSDLMFEIGECRTMESGRKPGGLYSPLENKITISNLCQHTVSHEIGHYLEYKFAREFDKLAATGLSGMTYNINAPAKRLQWATKFRAFVQNLMDKSDIRSEYTQRSGEVFARFIDFFIRWTMDKSGAKDYSTPQYFDRFAESDCRSFVYILQEKSWLDKNVPMQGDSSELV